MKSKYFLALSAVLLAGLIVHGSLSAAPEAASSGSQQATAKLGSPAPDFKLKDSFGKEFTISEFKGKPVILEWINQDCPVSKGAHEKKNMQNVYKKYADKGAVWLGIDSTHGMTAERNRVYAAQMGLAHPILLDPDGKVGHMYQAKRTPHMYVIDSAGVLVYDGAIDDQKETNYVAAALDDLLANRPVSKSRTDAYGCTIKYAPAN
jgi:peroxiredoxin